MQIRLPDESNFGKVTIAHTSALTEMPIKELQPKTKFILDQVNETGDYRTYMTNYDTLSSAAAEYIRTVDSATLQEEWVLSGKNNKTMCLDLLPLVNADKLYSDYYYGISTDSVHENAGNAAITYEFYVKGLLQKIYDLSAEIYKRPHVPSFKGMIIHSSTLTTEDAVKKIYGGKQWKQISFSFMCGAAKNGNTEENTNSQYGELALKEFKPGNTCGYAEGGEEYVKLRQENIPSHGHKFTAASERFEMSWRPEIRTGQIWMFERIRRDHGKGGSEGACPSPSFGIKNLRAKFTGEKTISTKNLYGNIKTTTEIFSSNGTKINVNSNHANMPPFETKYTWVRIL